MLKTNETITLHKGDSVLWGFGQNLGGAPFSGVVHSVDGDIIWVYGYGGLFKMRAEELTVRGQR